MCYETEKPCTSVVPRATKTTGQYAELCFGHLIEKCNILELCCLNKWYILTLLKGFLKICPAEKYRELFTKVNIFCLKIAYIVKGKKRNYIVHVHILLFRATSKSCICNLYCIFSDVLVKKCTV